MPRKTVDKTRLLALAHELLAVCETDQQRLYQTKYVPLSVEPVNSSSQVAARFGPWLANFTEEVFGVVSLDARNRAVSQEIVSRGTRTFCCVHPREVFRPAILARAVSVLLVHNHPSGDPTPSREDIELTARLRDAGKILGINVLDHIIVGGAAFRSLADMGFLKEFP